MTFICTSLSQWWSRPLPGAETEKGQTSHLTTLSRREGSEGGGIFTALLFPLEEDTPWWLGVGGGEKKGGWGVPESVCVCVCGGGGRLLNDIATFARRQHDLSSVQFNSIEDVVCALWKAHMRSGKPICAPSRPSRKCDKNNDNNSNNDNNIGYLELPTRNRP